MQYCQRHHFLPHEKPVDWMLMSPPLELTSSHHSHKGELLYVWVYELSRQGVPPPSWRNLLRKQVTMRKHHKVRSVCHLPSIRQVRLLEGGSIGSSAYSQEHFPEPTCCTKGQKFDIEGRGYVDINVGILDMEVLITMIKLERSDQS